MDDLNLTMFKQYDIRTRHNAINDMQKERLYNAIAVYFRDCVKAKSVVIGRDARLYVPELAEGLARVCRKAGIEVLINPLPISTCQFYYSCMKHRDSAGVMVTASHNPAEYIGLQQVLLKSRNIGQVDLTGRESAFRRSLARGSLSSGRAFATSRASRGREEGPHEGE